MEKPKILIARGIIDLYVGEKYLTYKHRAPRINHVARVLNVAFEHLKGKVISGVEIREVSITANNLYGGEDFCQINDLGHSAHNQVKVKENEVTLRIFSIDIYGIVVSDKYASFVLHKEDNFILQTSSARII